MEMKRDDDLDFLKMVWKIALPVALQSMLQASFGIVDQIMIGRLGGISVAGVGLAGKFASLYSVMIAAVGTAAGIMISQYIGQKNIRNMRRSFFVNLGLTVGIACLFTLLCRLVPERIMGLYTQDTDPAMRSTAAAYLLIYAWSFIPAAVMTLTATLLRCMEKAALPLYAGFASALLNTVLNYVLIFGKLGVMPMGVKGAALSSVIAQIAGLLIIGRSYYVLIYNVNDTVRRLTEQILAVYAVIAPLKVGNMILGGGIIRSGGKTGYVMGIDLIGTWLFGVPLGLFAAFILHLPIPYVYFMLSLEEGVRFLISLAVFRKKRWMRSI